jgi:hypothetical protein
VQSVRFALCRYGEDVNLCLEQFRDENASGNFVVCPIFSHGLPPRRALSTPASMRAALATVTLESGSALEQQWREVCEALGVSMTRRQAA